MSKFTDFFKKLGAGAKTVAVKVADAFVKLFGEDTAKKFAADSYHLLQSAVGKIVSQVVADLANSDLNSAAKREQAVAEIAKLTQAQGIQLAESEARLLIEIAVQFLKGKFNVTAA